MTIFELIQKHLEKDTEIQILRESICSTKQVRFVYKDTRFSLQFERRGFLFLEFLDEFCFKEDFRDFDELKKIADMMIDRKKIASIPWRERKNNKGVTK